MALYRATVLLALFCLAASHHHGRHSKWKEHWKNATTGVEECEKGVTPTAKVCKVRFCEEDENWEEDKCVKEACFDGGENCERICVEGEEEEDEDCTKICKWKEDDDCTKICRFDQNPEDDDCEMWRTKEEPRRKCWSWHPIHRLVITEKMRKWKAIKEKWRKARAFQRNMTLCEAGVSPMEEHCRVRFCEAEETWDEDGCATKACMKDGENCERVCFKGEDCKRLCYKRDQDDGCTKVCRFDETPEDDDCEMLRSDEVPDWGSWHPLYHMTEIDMEDADEATKKWSEHRRAKKEKWEGKRKKWLKSRGGSGGSGGSGGRGGRGGKWGWTKTAEIRLPECPVGVSPEEQNCTARFCEEGETWEVEKCVERACMKEDGDCRHVCFQGEDCEKICTWHNSENCVKVCKFDQNPLQDGCEMLRSEDKPKNRWVRMHPLFQLTVTEKMRKWRKDWKDWEKARAFQRNVTLCGEGVSPMDEACRIRFCEDGENWEEDGCAVKACVGSGDNCEKVCFKKKRGKSNEVSDDCAKRICFWKKESDCTTVCRFDQTPEDDDCEMLRTNEVNDPMAWHPLYHQTEIDMEDSAEAIKKWREMKKEKAGKWHHGGHGRHHGGHGRHHGGHGRHHGGHGRHHGGHGGHHGHRRHHRGERGRRGSRENSHNDLE